MFESCIYESSYLDYPEILNSDEAIWILGKCYQPNLDREALKNELISKFWFTYRKNFVPINQNTYLTTDAGWGCMIRSGQMMLAEALTRYYDLPYNSNLNKQNHEYEISDSPSLNSDIDTKKNVIKEIDKNDLCKTSNNYNISHMINNAKRYLYEMWYTNNNTNILCSPSQCQSCERGHSFNSLYCEKSSAHIIINNYKLKTTKLHILKLFLEDPQCKFSIHNISTSSKFLESNTKNKTHKGDRDNSFSVPGKWFGPNSVSQAIKNLIKNDTRHNIIFHVAMDNAIILSDIKNCFEEKATQNTNKVSALDSKVTAAIDKHDASLILVVPLRLGLTHIIPSYFEALKAFFQLPQCIGILGGKPKHASWYIGYTGNDLIYLDPHTVQKSLNLKEFTENYRSWLESNSQSPNNPFSDPFPQFISTFHCGFPSASENDEDDENRDILDGSIGDGNKVDNSICNHVSFTNGPPSKMAFDCLDPSLSLAFFCANQLDFEKLCSDIKKHLIQPFPCPMFEILEQPLPLWTNGSEKFRSDNIIDDNLFRTPFELDSDPSTSSRGFNLSSGDNKADLEDFEVI
ncbi:unnamed protein product [Gordionus sp. m RMFG-2023]